MTTTTTPLYHWSIYDNNIGVEYKGGEEFNEFDTVIEVLADMINDLQKENEQLKKVKIEQLTTINNLRISFDDQAKKIEDLRIRINERDRMIAELQLRVNGRDRKITELEKLKSLITDKDEIIAKQNEMLTDIVQIARGKKFKL